MNTEFQHAMQEHECFLCFLCFVAVGLVENSSQIQDVPKIADCRMVVLGAGPIGLVSWQMAGMEWAILAVGWTRDLTCS